MKKFRHVSTILVIIFQYFYRGSVIMQMFQSNANCGLYSGLYTFSPEQLDELLAEVSAPDKFLREWTPFRDVEHYQRVMNNMKALQCFGQSYDTLQQDEKEFVEKKTLSYVGYFSVHSDIGVAVGAWHKLPVREVYKKLHCGYFDDYSHITFYVASRHAGSIDADLLGCDENSGAVDLFYARYEAIK